MNPDEVTMATTVDADIHVFAGQLEEVQRKVEWTSGNNKWMRTVDGRLVKGSAVVSIWTPTEFELKNYMAGLGEG